MLSWAQNRPCPMQYEPEYLNLTPFLASAKSPHLASLVRHGLVFMVSRVTQYFCVQGETRHAIAAPERDDVEWTPGRDLDVHGRRHMSPNGGRRAPSSCARAAAIRSFAEFDGTTAPTKPSKPLHRSSAVCRFESRAGGRSDKAESDGILTI